MDDGGDEHMIHEYMRHEQHLCLCTGTLTYFLLSRSFYCENGWRLEARPDGKSVIANC